MSEQAVLDPSRGAAPPPRLAVGTELVGEYQGSGYREPRYLVARADGQLVQLPALLYRLAAEIDGRRDHRALAAALSAEGGREITAEQVARLVETRLQPAGVVTAGNADPDGSAAPSRPDPLLMLRFRLPVVPAAVAWRIAGVFAPLFRRPVVVAVLAATVAADLAVLLSGGLAELPGALVGMVAQPASALLVIGVLVGAGALHECGHAGACRFGGARPGAMGVGVYLVWPAFYSTVTDSYRLSRAGRLRTDLGGVYLNAAVLAAVAGVHLATGAGWALVALAALHVETVRQFLPSIRLDGYYILSDLIGLPDLFMFLGPVLRGLLPWRATDPRVAELRPWVRRTIVAWVLLVVPLLLGLLLLFAALVPQVLPEVLDAVRRHLATAAAGLRAADPALAGLSAVQALLVVLPVLGGGLLLGMWGGRAVGALRADRPRPRREGARPWHVLLAVAVPVGLLVVLVGQGLDQRLATADEARLAAAAAAVTGPLDLPAGAAAHQVAALAALLGLAGGGVTEAARGTLLVAGALAALLLWPLARRLGLPPGAAALAVALAGLPALAAPVLGTLAPGGLAALWLVVAAGLAGRGRGGTAAAAGAAALAVWTAPVAAAGLLAFAAHATARGQLAGTWRRGAARAAAALLGAGAVAVAVAVVTVPGPGPGAVPGPVLAALLVTGAAVVAVAQVRLRGQRPVATGAGVLLACAAVPAPAGTSALLLALPALALVSAVLVHRGPRPAAAGPLTAGVVLATAAALGPAVTAAVAPGTDPDRLAQWVRAEVDPAVPLRTDALTAAQLVAGGVPADRIEVDGVGAPAPGRAAAPPAAAALTVRADRLGAPPAPGRVVFGLRSGPGGAPLTVHTAPTPDEEGTSAAGRRLAGNPRLHLAPVAAAAVRGPGVDPRLAATLVELAAADDLTVAALPAVDGEPPAALRRTAVVTAVGGRDVHDPGIADVLRRRLAAQPLPHPPPDAVLRPAGLLLRHPLPVP